MDVFHDRLHRQQRADRACHEGQQKQPGAEGPPRELTRYTTDRSGSEHHRSDEAGEQHEQVVAFRERPVRHSEAEHQPHFQQANGSGILHRHLTPAPGSPRTAPTSTTPASRSVHTVNKTRLSIQGVVYVFVVNRRRNSAANAKLSGCSVNGGEESYLDVAIHPVKHGPIAVVRDQERHDR